MKDLDLNNKRKIEEEEENNEVISNDLVIEEDINSSTDSSDNELNSNSSTKPVEIKEINKDSLPMSPQLSYLYQFPQFNDPTADETAIQFKKSKLGLPKWLAEPKLIHPDDVQELSELEGLLDKGLIDKCKGMNITHLFAVQKAVLPTLLTSRHPNSTRFPPGDLLVSAPTGSGKTLGYALPIVNKLLNRTVPRVRALIILPTRDLVAQVRATFAGLVEGTNLKVQPIYNKTSFINEQMLLVDELDEIIPGGSSKVDIVICTPGRLIDHLEKTKNFTLQHLEYLVLDEADRLLNDQFYGFLSTVLNHLDQPILSNLNTSFKGHTAIPYHSIKNECNYLISKFKPQLQKLLFSATLTRNPEKINKLKLNSPTYLSIKDELTSDKYSTPSTLKEFTYVVQLNTKPLSLIYLIDLLKINQGLIFTKSVESAFTLYQFLLIHLPTILNLKDLKIHHFSSNLSGKDRFKIIKQFKNKTINILICSDLVARGLDVDDVDVVVNYDPPQFIKQYVHRIGRTARKGKDGKAFTLVCSNEVTPFHNIQKKANRLNLIKRLKTLPDHLKPYSENYEDALQQTQQKLQS